MISKLAYRNLIHDRIRFAVTLVGIQFAIVLIAIQLGLYLGAEQIIVGIVDHTTAEVWVMAYRTKNFEEAEPVNQRAMFFALSTPGVAAVAPMMAAFSRWKRPEGGSVTVVVVGADAADGAFLPWNIAEGNLAALETRDGVFVDTTYLDELGVESVGDRAQINGTRVRVVGLTSGIRSFTTTPFVFMSFAHARELIGVAQDELSYALVQLKPNFSAEDVRAKLQAKLPNELVLTKLEFRQRTLNHWLYATGAGVALIGGAVLGLVVGTVIVAQTLYSSTKDHLSEFATLRALGSSAWYIHRVILAQAAISGAVGYLFGMTITLAVIAVSLKMALPLPIIMTPWLAVFLFAITIFMCSISAIAAINKVTRIDPAMVFNK